MSAETGISRPDSSTITRRRTLLVGATGLALAEILTHADLILAKKKNKHKKCKKRCKKHRDATPASSASRKNATPAAGRPGCRESRLDGGPASDSGVPSLQGERHLDP